MGTILKGATLIELEPACVEVADLRVDGGRITARGPGLAEGEGDEVIDLRGKLVMPGLVCGHHDPATIFARGLPGLQTPPKTYQELDEQVRTRLWRALDGDALQAGATATALEALCAGTTTVFAQVSAPKATAGSLFRTARGFNEVGLRGVMSYAVSDRHGALVREEALDESAAFRRKAKGRFRGLLGVDASFAVSNDALAALRDVARELGPGVQLLLAEDVSDERVSFERHGQVPVQRFMEAGLFGPNTLAVHAVQLSWPELSQVISTGTWLVHAPRSNLRNQVGYAPAGKFGARALLGCVDEAPDLFAEAAAAELRALDAGQPISTLRYLANGHRVASQVFGEMLGPLREGALADLLVLDYRPVTPLDARTLPFHLTQALGARHVESVMIDGVWRQWVRRPLSLSPDSALDDARHAAAEVWGRLTDAS